MSKESLEHLSSLMDGELSHDAGIFLARRMSSDDALCDTWERYHLIRDCIRQPGSKQAVIGLSAKLSASLDAEELEESTLGSRWRNKPWLKPVSGLAIAASVALMAIVVTAPQPTVSPDAGDTALSTPAVQQFVSPNALPLAPVTQAASFAPAQQTGSNRLNAYLLRHNQMARTAGRQGFVSFVPIVATPAANAEEPSEEESETANARSTLGTPENR